MKKCILVLVLCMVCAVVYAGQKYNPYTGDWETVPDDWDVQYNPYEGEWSYQPDDASVEYNPYEQDWEWDSGHNPYED